MMHLRLRRQRQMCIRDGADVKLTTGHVPGPRGDGPNPRLSGANLRVPVFWVVHRDGGELEVRPGVARGGSILGR